MRNVSSTVGWQFRIPHFAFRIALAVLALATPAAAQVDPSGPWRTLHTPHFRVHFRPIYRAVALDAAAEAERAYGLLASELRPPRGTIDLVVSDDVDAPNGFATTFPSNRMTIVLTSPVGDPALHRHDSWRRLVIVHELAHLFHLDRSRGLWRALQGVFGRAPGLFPNQFQPSWVVEGLATYYESRFTTAGRADGSFHREVVAADALGGSARSPWDALLFTRWPAGLTPYAYGSRFWTRLADRDETLVPRFVERTAGQLIPFRVGRPLRLAGAREGRGGLAAAWSEAVDAAQPDADSAAPSRRIVGALRSQPVPRVSPDGRRVAYLHDDGRGARRLRIVDWPGGRTLRSQRVTGQVSYDWLGDTLVVAQLEFTGRWRVRSDLWRWLPDGEWRRVTRGARLIEPRGGAALQLTPGDNAPIGSLAPPRDPAIDAPGTTWGTVVPSPDRRWVAATRHQGGAWALVRWPAAAPESVAVLARSSSGVQDPAWMGTDVLFVDEVEGFPQVHAWREPGVVTRLTAEPLGARSPAALPDGSLLVTSLARDGWELRALPPDELPRRAAPLPAAVFDSAPAVPARETGYAALGSLRPHFWLPLVFDAGRSGVFLGATTLGGDAIGRYAYVLEALIAPQPLRAQGAIGVVTHALGNPTVDVLVANDWSHVGETADGRFVVSAADYEAVLGVTFAARRWRRFVSLRLAAEYEGARYVARPDTALAAICTGCARSDRVGGSVSLAAGTLVTAPLTVSPQDGAVVNALYRRREEQGSARASNEVRGRVVLYARLGPRVGFAYPVLAARIAAGATDGALVGGLPVGGVSEGAIPLPLGQSFGATRSFPVRGYSAGARRGRRAATATLEYRIPLALVGRALGHLPIGLDKLSLAVFGDIGDAWEPGEDARLHRLRAVGVELVSDLRVTFDVPLRLRLGVAQPAHRRPRVYVAAGADF